MEFQDFLDKLYQVFSQTTGAEDRFWTVTKIVHGDDELFEVYAVGEDEDDPWFIGTFNSEVDADFTASIHGAIADLVRRSMEAVDDAARLELERDNLMGRVFDLELEIQGLKSELGRYEGLE
ncbi:hypothetical protein SEA_STLSCUM_44 [Mycobacterium phage STLscum]|uniref:hypothetical protein n=1 Tax=Mycobacterium phage Alsfro TaxID=1458724 RepID=UPI00042F07C9|nr:hypothetical protein PBI_ALSFRO_47 [Mycobacterium phage Alsfro]AHK12098.1 hypothetical protein PBI_ALSFRO_47 [Mycobacterium phage Alsfro]QAX93205.1 hypothetical protein SEA_BEATRIX_42 [Mycobacterium phage Beatrix]QOP65907.1 hypothetical protein SEA_STLSCUM_44 [Mycobacterium phage STLscum]